MVNQTQAFEVQASQDLAIAAASAVLPINRPAQTDRIALLQVAQAGSLLNL